MLRALFAGLGGIGQRHLRNLRAVCGDRLAVSAYRVRGQSHVLSDTLQIAAESGLEATYDVTTYTNLDEALADPPDVVFVCNPTSLHLEVALAAARRGCALFIEKPLADTMDGVEALAALVESRGLVAMVGYQLRFHPCIQRLLALVGERAVGHLVSVHAEVGEFLPGWHPYEDYRQMYASRRDLGGGVILAQIHELDYLYALVGLPTRVFAVGGHLSDLEVDVEDTATMLMACEVDGRPLPVSLHVDYLQRPAARGCTVVGDRGKIVVDLLEPSLRRFDREGAEVETFRPAGFQRNQLFLDQTRHLLACLEGRETPIVPIRDGAQSLRVALAAKASLASGVAEGLG
ncbi:MAG: Gfo/Idh/MocA family protein [Vicinamibacterales bacterium]